MKNLVFFLVGACVGAGGTFIYLHKDIKKWKEELVKSTEVPFVVEDKKEENKEEEKQEEDDEKPVNARKEAKIEYHKIVQNYGDTPTVMSNDVWNGTPPVPVVPREVGEERPMVIEDPNGFEVDRSQYPEGIYEIDKDEYMRDNTFEKERYTWYRGDHIMATEDGTKIQNPGMLVGRDWEMYVGNYAQSTAFVRNPRLCIDYEIYVDEGLYSDDYRSDDEYGGNI